jgi:hypothetical protein
MSRITYEKYKGKDIFYDENSNKWAIEGFDDEALDSLKAAREYIEKTIKAVFSRFRALADGRLGEITSITANCRKAWFTPDMPPGSPRGYGDHRRQVNLEDIYPVENNVVLIAEHERLEATLAELQAAVTEANTMIYKNKGKMQSYGSMHPEMFE